MKIKAKIRNRKEEWDEEFDVPNNIEPETYIRDIIKNFNATLKPYESPRKFVRIVETREYSEMSTDELVKLYKELRVKQLLLLHKNFFDEISGDWAKRCYKAISRIKNLQTLSDYLVTVPHTLLNRSFEEVVDELLKRGRKLIR